MRYHRLYLVLITILLLGLGLAACSQPAQIKVVEKTETQAQSHEEAGPTDLSQTEEAQSAAKANGKSEDAQSSQTSSGESTLAGDQAEKAELESLVEVRNELDKQVTYQEVLAQEDGSYSFHELAISDLSAWLDAQDKPVFLDFWAPWCKPCLLASPEVDGLASQYGDKLRVLKVNVSDLAPEVVASFEIYGIPHFVLLNKQDIQADWAGFGPGRMDEIRQSIDQFLN